MDQPVCVRLTPPSHVKEFEPGNFPDSNCVSVEIKTSSRLWPAIRSCGAAKDGGADRDRTDDLKLAKLALSQLSYGPGNPGRQVVGPGRVERPTSRLSGVRSNHLSYEPERGVRVQGAVLRQTTSAQSSRAGFSTEGRETKAAASRRCLSTDVWNNS